VHRPVLVLLAILALLALTGCGMGVRTVSGYGISLAVPTGWHADVNRGSWRLTSGTPRLTFELFEDTADSAWSPPFDRAAYRPGAPRPFGAGEFGRRYGARRNFRVAGRLFDLFVFGPKGLPASRLAQLNTVLHSLRIRPGDFYPGRVAPARFRPAHGWFVRHQGALAVGTDNFVFTVASTAPWHDALNVTYPTQSLARVRRTHGVAILVNLEADNRYPPAARSAPLRFGPPQQGWAGDGPTIPGVQTQSGTGAVAREYSYGVTVIYGGAHPSERQRALARAELRRLVLPSWPRWR
jgi:hypothetical protein